MYMLFIFDNRKIVIQTLLINIQLYTIYYIQMSKSRIYLYKSRRNGPKSISLHKSVYESIIETYLT